MAENITPPNYKFLWKQEKFKDFLAKGSNISELVNDTGYLTIATFPTGNYVTTSSFNAFTSSYNTGSFTGSFSGDGSGLTNLPIGATGSNGEIQFNSGGSFGADSGLVWDNTNKRLGVGSNNPTQRLTIRGNILLDDSTLAPRLQIWNDNVGLFRSSNDMNISGFGGIVFRSSATSMLNQTERMRIASNGNVGIGTATPQSRLDIRAQGTLTSDIPFRIRNSANTADILRINATGGLSLTNPSVSANAFEIVTLNNNQHRIGNVVANLTFGSANLITANAGLACVSLSSTNINATSGISTLSFNPTNQFVPGGTSTKAFTFFGNYSNAGAGATYSGTLIAVGTQLNTTIGNVTLNNFVSENAVNTTGGTSILRGFYHNPTLISTTNLTNIAFENTTGHCLFGTTSGNVGIGQSTPQARLDVRAQGALSTDIALRVRNSANDRNLFEVLGNGDIEVRTNRVSLIHSRRLSIGGGNNDNSVDSTLYDKNVLLGFDNTNNSLRSTIIGSENTTLSSATPSTILGYQNTNSDNGITVGHSNNYRGIIIGTNNVGGSVGRGVIIGDNNSLSEVNGNPTQPVFLLGNGVSIPNNTSVNNCVFISAGNNSQLPYNTFKNDNLLIGSLVPWTSNFDNDSRGVFYTRNGVAPTTLAVDTIAFYSADIVAGNAAPHFRTEAGNIIKLYQQPAVTSSQGLADVLTNLGLLSGSSVITPLFPFTGSAEITGSLAVTGSITSTQIGVGATPSGTTRLDVRAQGALSTDSVLRVRNSADTLDILEVRGDNRTFVRNRFSVESASGTTILDIINGANNATIELTGGQLDIIAPTRQVFTNNSSEKFRVDNTYSRFQNNVSIGSGTTFGTNATNTLKLDNGVAPSTSPSDAFQLYSADIVAGNAAPHFRTENGSIIKLYKEIQPALSGSANTGDAATDALIEAMKTIILNLGFGASS
jgi:hypothetical protein